MTRREEKDWLYDDSNEVRIVRSIRKDSDKWIRMESDIRHIKKRQLRQYRDSHIRVDGSKRYWISQSLAWTTSYILLTDLRVKGNSITPSSFFILSKYFEECHFHSVVCKWDKPLIMVTDEYASNGHSQNERTVISWEDLSDQSTGRVFMTCVVSISNVSMLDESDIVNNLSTSTHSASRFSYPLTNKENYIASRVYCQSYINKILTRSRLIINVFYFW